MSLPSAKQALLAQISQSRTAVLRDSRILKDELNLASKLRDSVRNHPSFWLGGAAVSGYLMNRLFAKKKNPPPKKGGFFAHFKNLKWGGMTLLALFRIFFPLVIKPAIDAYTANTIPKKAG